LSTDIGRSLRMKRMFKGDGKVVVVALDHGAFMGPAPGWVDPAPTVEAVVKGGADAIMTTIGIVEKCGHLAAGKSGIILSTPMSTSMDATVDAAMNLGVDALKIFATVGGPEEQATMASLWSTSLACKKRGLPLLAEMFPVKSEKVPNPMDKDVIAKYSRIGAEMGADFIKTFYTGDSQSFRYVAESCPVPVIILGGAKMETDRDLLKVVKDSLEAGAGGVAFGRNIWQHKNPEGITRAIEGVVHQGWTVEEALRHL
jgi:fructose-bisphosphate aldolase / 2-amino-3,7-dideoxy-D-threo-hept-6-ulosonate synthase